MESKQEKKFKVPASLCDDTARISIPGIFDLFQDLASEHGRDIRLGREDLGAKGLIWIVSKTKVLIHERPEMLTPVTAATWPEAPGRIRCNRYYTLSGNGILFAEGKNEWAMIEAATGKPRRPSDIYPGELVHLEDRVCEAPFFRGSDDFEGCAELARYTVRSVDIDGSRHMNNVAYLRAALGAFSCGEIEKMNVREVDAAYKSQSYEGEELSIRVKQEEGAHILGILKPGGKTAAVIRLA